MLCSTTEKGVNKLKNNSTYLGHVYSSLEVKCTGCHQTVILAKKWLIANIANLLENMLVYLDILPDVAPDFQ